MAFGIKRFLIRLLGAGCHAHGFCVGMRGPSPSFLICPCSASHSIVMANRITFRNGSEFLLGGVRSYICTTRRMPTQSRGNAPSARRRSNDGEFNEPKQLLQPTQKGESLLRVMAKNAIIDCST